MKFFKSDFSRVHFAVMLFALANVIIGLLMALSILPYGSFAEIHSFTGVLLLPILILMPLLFRRRKQLYAAMKVRFLITRRDIAQKRPVVLAAKGVTWLMALAFVVQLLTAFFIETGLAYRLFPDFSMMRFHVIFVYIMPVLILLHMVLMKLVSVPKPVVSH